jgi:hypothetical protein
MTAALAAPPRAAGRPFALVGLVGLVAALALAGALIAVLAFTAHDEDGGHAHPAELGLAIPTSFGAVTVEHATTLGGLTAGDLAGVTHGIQNLVLSDKAQVEVSFLLGNTGDAPVRVDPSQFQLLVEGSSKPVDVTGSTVHPLWLRPGASVEASVTFVVPQTGAQMSVAYQDPGAAAAITVPIGSLGEAPAPVDSEHSH